jgi:hypothetical protein
MTLQEALDHVCGIATNWGENAEEAYTRRIEASDTDEILRDKAGPGADEADLDSMREIRDLWRAIEMLRTGRSTSVFGYFTEKLGAAPTDETLDKLPCDSNCGADCVRAVDAAAAFIKHLRASTDEAENIETVTRLCQHVCETYWHG